MSKTIKSITTICDMHILAGALQIFVLLKINR